MAALTRTTAAGAAVVLAAAALVLAHGTSPGEEFVQECHKVGGQVVYSGHDWLGRRTGGACWVLGELAETQEHWQARQ